MPEGGQIPKRPGGGRLTGDTRESLLIELAQHLREAADIVEALAEPDDA